MNQCDVSRLRSIVFFLMLLSLAVTSFDVAWGVDSATSPRPIPLTRPEMKQYLEDMKGRALRIPLPELTDAEKEKLGERASSYESRLRYHYLPHLEGTGFNGPTSQSRGTGGVGIGRDNDPDNTLDYAFKVQLFWIVSRTNNCQYCLGHQESKLLAAGMTEDQIAALDGDWSEHNPQERAAYAFARKFTFEPHLLNNADINGLKKFFTDKQILEMILSMAGNNSINRWKEGAGIPQSSNGGNFGGRRLPSDGTAKATVTESPKEAEKHHSYLTPTSPKYVSLVSKVAPVLMDSVTGQPTRTTMAVRPKLESRSEVETALIAAKVRAARLPLADAETSREVLPEGFSAETPPNWVRLLATFPYSAKTRINSIRLSDEQGDLTLLMKAQLAWIIGRQDRAWYATGQAYRRLRKLGQTEDQIYSLDGDWSGFPSKERSLFTLARKLSGSPVVLTDADVAEALRQVGPRDVVQAISYTTTRASFDRITEAVGLPLED